MPGSSGFGGSRITLPCWNHNRTKGTMRCDGENVFLIPVTFSLLIYLQAAEPLKQEAGTSECLFLLEKLLK